VISLVGALEIRAQEVSVQLAVPDSAISGENFQISVMIAKGNNTSFAKLQLEMPPAFKVDSLDGDSARFSQADSKAKYIWDRMPHKDTLIVKFQINTDPGFSGLKGVNGYFAYILNEEKKEIAIPTKAIKMKKPVVLATIEERDPDVSEIQQLSAPLAEEKEASALNETRNNDIAKSALVKTLIEFRIQIVASGSKVEINGLQSKYGITDNIRTELHNGLWKYTVGSYGTYEAAKGKLPLYREEKNVLGAFITAYQNEQRISVRSAINQTK